MYTPREYGLMAACTTSKLGDKHSMEQDVWCNLPEVVLAQIFSYLSLVDKLTVSDICSSWCGAVGRREVWSHFIYSEIAVWKDLIRKNTSHIIGHAHYQEFHEKLLLCIQEHGKHFSHISIQLKRGVSFEVFDYVSQYCCNVVDINMLEHIIAEQGVLLRTLDKRKYKTFLSTLSKFFQKNLKIRRIRIDGILHHCGSNEELPLGIKNALSLQSLWITNSCLPSNLLFMYNLTELALTPTYLDFSVIKLLAGCSLKDLYIIANSGMKIFHNNIIRSGQWKEISRAGPHLRVHCYVSLNDLWSGMDTFFRRSIPLNSLIYNNFQKITYMGELVRILANFGATLEEFADIGRVDKPRPPSNIPTVLSDRFDHHALQIVARCSKLTTLMVKEPISSACLIIIAHQRRQLLALVVPEDKVEYADDLPAGTFMDVETAAVVQNNFQTRDKLCYVMSSLLGRAWKPLSQPEYHDMLENEYQKLLQ